MALQFALQGPMRRAVDALDAGEVGALGFLVTTVHSWTGATIALLLAWRVALRRGRARDAAGREGRDVPDAGAGPAGPRPGLPARLRRAVAAANHASLYLVTGSMAASGALHWYGGVESAARWHGILKWVLAGLVALHVAAALWHALVRRDDILPAMAGRRGPAARLERS